MLEKMYGQERSALMHAKYGEKYLVPQDSLPRRQLNKAVLGLPARTGQGARCGVRAHAKADIGGKPCPGW